MKNMEERCLSPVGAHWWSASITTESAETMSAQELRLLYLCWRRDHPVSPARKWQALAQLASYVESRTGQASPLSRYFE